MFTYVKKIHMLVVHPCNLSYWEVEAGRPRIPVLLSYSSEASLGCRKPYLMQSANDAKAALLHLLPKNAHVMEQMPFLSAAIYHDR